MSYAEWDGHWVIDASKPVTVGKDGEEEKKSGSGRVDDVWLHGKGFPSSPVAVPSAIASLSRPDVSKSLLHSLLATFGPVTERSGACPTSPRVDCRLEAILESDLHVVSADEAQTLASAATMLEYFLLPLPGFPACKVLLCEIAKRIGKWVLKRMVYDRQYLTDAYKRNLGFRGGDYVLIRYWNAYNGTLDPSGYDPVTQVLLARYTDRAQIVVSETWVYGHPSAIDFPWSAFMNLDCWAPPGVSSC